jgi:hypothetical protein
MEELSLIAGGALVLEMIAFLVITYKMENQKVSKSNIFKGFLLAIIMVFFTYYGDLTFGQMIPFFSTFFYTFNGFLMLFILFNRFYKNNLIVSVLKTIITFVVVIICQLCLLPLIALISMVLPYDPMLMIINYVAQIWIIIFMFKIYPKFRNRVNNMILDFSKYPRRVWGVFIYLLLYVVIVTYIKYFLVNDNQAFITLILISASILIGLTFIIYKYFIKLDEETAGRSLNVDMIEE